MKEIKILQASQEVPKLISDVNDIRTDLSVTLNSKHITTNGVKEFECGNGYVDNVVIEGQTLVNLSKIGSRSWNSISNDAIRTRFVDTYAHTFNDRITNGQFTCFNYTDKRLSFTQYTKTGTFINASLTKVEPYSSRVFTLDSNTSIIGVDFWVSDGWLQSQLDTVTASMFSIVEGDHTSKNISYFEGLKSVGQNDKIEVLTYGENIFTYDNCTLGSYISGEDGNTTTTNEMYGYSDYIPCEPNTTYVSNINHAVFVYDESKKCIQSQTSIGLAKLPITTLPNAKYIRININKEKPIVYISKLHDKKQILTTARSTPNGTKDIIYKQGDKYYKIKRCGEYTINGNETINLYSTLTNTLGFSVQIPNNYKKYGVSDLPNIYSNLLSQTDHTSLNNSDIEKISLISNYDTGTYGCLIRISKTKLSSQDLTGFKTWLSQNPVTVVYELATPVIEELPNFNPRCFNDKSTILLNTGVVQGEASFEVTNSTRSELEVLKKKSSDIEEGLLNNRYGFQNHKITDKYGYAVVTEKNINTIFDTGIYSVVSLGDNQKLLPKAYGWWLLRVYARHKTCCIQEVIQYDELYKDFSIYIRKLYSPTNISEWQKLSATSTLSLLEQQVSELEIQAMERGV